MTNFSETESAFVALISHLNSGSTAIESALATATERFAQLETAQLTADEVRRLRSLHRMALGLTSDALASVSSELGRVQTARKQLRNARSSRPAPRIGTDCDMTG